tara:strand:- start:6631 stop:7737 length:1107 start_codon:yes stop_codon:yes gene_type:complete
MPIEVGIWKLGDSPSPIVFEPMESESKLEEVLAHDLGIADPSLLLIGRQVPTDHGKFIDLLAIDADGKLVVLELKKNRTPREVVAQLLDYGSWVRTQEDHEIADLFESYLKKYEPCHAGTSLDDAFCAKFGVKSMPESLNDSHELVLVAGELDDSSERIIGYLADEYGVAINAVFFRFFRDGDNEYLSRAWLIDPGEVDAKVEEKREKGQWNGEYYVSYGHGLGRDWEDAQKYGFISAGGGAWYSRTLSILEPGARIWVNIPGSGYAGVGIVEDVAVPFGEFKVEDADGNRVPFSSLPLSASYHKKEEAADPTKVERFVRVKWLKTVPVSEAFREKGFFGNQNSAAKPRAKSWQYTVERLKQRFGVVD